MKIEMNIKSIIFALIIIICILALSFGIYSQIFIKPNKEVNEVPVEEPKTEIMKFDELFDNKINLQDYTSVNYVSKIEPAKDVVFTTYSFNEIYENKYEIHANIPAININHENAIKIDQEIISIFYDKINSIINKLSEAEDKEKVEKCLYTVTYTAYLNENILSLVIKANLKEGDNAQREIIKAYTYNISTNEKVTLEKMVQLKAVKANLVENEIKETIQDAVNYSKNLSSLGYETYVRDMKSEMYTIENSDNYFLGPNEGLYIIYAYGNMNFTTEKDIVYIK